VLLLLTPLVLRFIIVPEVEVVPSPAEFFPVHDEVTGRWGFIDNAGKAITPMVFDWAGDFRSGRGLAERDGAMGFIDANYETTGEWAIAPRFELKNPGDMPAHGFSEGLALARGDSGEWGYIDTTGKWAIPPGFAENERDYPGVPAGDFSDGLAWFQVIEMTERYILDDEEKLVRDEEGVPLKERYPRRLMGFIDRTGKVVIEPHFEIVQDFGEGLAAARDRSSELWGFIDRTGKRVISPNFQAVDRFSEGLCATKDKGRWGYVSKTGMWIIEPTFDEARQFMNGLAAAREGERWGYIDTNGQWVISPRFDYFEDFGHPGNPTVFENDLARVTLNGKRIYINAQGEQVWPKND